MGVLCLSLQHVSMFQYASYARAWTRQAPWYVPCAPAVCVRCGEFAACAYVHSAGVNV